MQWHWLCSQWARWKSSKQIACHIKWFIMTGTVCNWNRSIISSAIYRWKVICIIDEAMIDLLLLLHYLRNGLDKSQIQAIEFSIKTIGNFPSIALIKFPPKRSSSIFMKKFSHLIFKLAKRKMHCDHCFSGLNSHRVRIYVYFNSFLCFFNHNNDLPSFD